MGMSDTGDGLQATLAAADELDQRRQQQIKQQRDVITRLINERNKVRDMLQELRKKGQISEPGFQDLWRIINHG